MAGRSLNRHRTVTKKGGPVDPLRFYPTRKSLFGSAGLVAMTVLIEVSGLVPGMFVMSTGFFLGHVRLPLAGSLGERSSDLLGSPAAPPIRVPLPAL